ncbi:hypothetical protein Tco_0731549 [Tanacetum coccineum]
MHISFSSVIDAVLGLFTGIKINSMVNLSHLFYADDAIFLGQWSELNIDSLVRVLDCFFWASGLRINMCKSKIMGVNVEDGMVKNAASKLGFVLSFKTHSLIWVRMWGGKFVKEASWKEVVDSRFFNGQDPKSNKASWVKWNKIPKIFDEVKLGNWVNTAVLGRHWYRLVLVSSRAVPTKLMAVFSVASIRKEIDGNRFQDVSLPTSEKMDAYDVLLGGISDYWL